MRELIAVIDFESHNKQAVARYIRSKNVYCEVYHFSIALDKISEKKPKGIVYLRDEEESDEASANVHKAISALDIPILSPYNERGGKSLHWYDPSKIDRFDNISEIDSFLFDICGCGADWTMEAFSAELIESIRSKVGSGKVLCALSGGVDSSVVATLIHKAIGKNLVCVFVDHGLLRLNEAKEVVDMFTNKFDLNLIAIDAEQRFLDKLAGVADPEKKRKIIGEEFIRIFEEEGNKIGKVDFLAQGTVYSDVIESGVGGSNLVKSHHNVGGLPSVIDFKEILEPVANLFKDEVRKLGLVLGLPQHMVARQAFPGPGIGIRVLGELTKEKLDVLRQADFIFRDELHKNGLDNEAGQYFAVLPGIMSVGVKNGVRTYCHAVILRAVHTKDAMTAKIAELPIDFLKQVSFRITAEVDSINRVLFDITDKPPSTIEYE